MDAREHQTFKDYRFFLPSMDPSVGSSLLEKGIPGLKYGRVEMPIGLPRPGGDAEKLWPVSVETPIGMQGGLPPRGGAAARPWPGNAFENEANSQFPAQVTVRSQ